MPFTTRNGVRLHWQEEGQGTPILLVMGHRLSSALWYPIVPALAAKHRVIRFDNRGTGDSDTTRKVTVADFAADAFAVMDAAGVDRAHIFGVSMGGVIVIEMALQKPKRIASLIVGCSGILSAEKPRAPAAVRLLYYLPRWALRLLMPARRLAKSYGSAAPAKDVAVDIEMAAKDKSNNAGLVAQAKAIARYTTTRAAVARLAMPSLVIHGDEDSLVPFAYGVELAETLPDSRFVKIEGSGHNFLVAAREKSTTAVLEFVAEVDSKRENRGRE